MSTYDIRALADTNGNVLWMQYGEVLRLLNEDVVDVGYIISMLNNPTYEACFRLFVLNPDESVNHEIAQEDIIIDSGNFNENYQSGQRKNLNISLINIDGKYTPSINTIWIHNKFRLDIGMKINNKTYWFPRGIYILNNPSVTHNDSDKQISLSLVDKFAILEGKAGTLETTYEIPVGSDIKQAIEGILNLDSGSGYPIDLKPIIYDKTFEGRTMPYTLTKDAGSTFGEMILDIGTILNAEIYYNSQGNLCVININETTQDNNKASLWDYSEDDGNYCSSSVSYDFENAINEVQVVGDNIDNAIYSASSKNINPESPLCIQRIGRRIEYINDSNIYNDTLAKQRANYELRNLSILRTTITLTVSFNPLLFVNNIITITDDYFGIERGRYLIQSISYNIGSSNQMTLSCSNVDKFKIDSLDYGEYITDLALTANLDKKLLSLQFDDLLYEDLGTEQELLRTNESEKYLSLNVSHGEGFRRITLTENPDIVDMVIFSINEDDEIIINKKEYQINSNVGLISTLVDNDITQNIKIVNIVD